MKVCSHCGAVWDDRHERGECGVAQATERILEHYVPRTPVPRTPEREHNRVEVEHVGFLRWEWEARGVNVRSIDGGTYITLPTGHAMLLDKGVAFTRKGALRRGQRVLRRYCTPRGWETYPQK